MCGGIGNLTLTFGAWGFDMKNAWNVLKKSFEPEPEPVLEKVTYTFEVYTRDYGPKLKIVQTDKDFVSGLGVIKAMSAEYYIKDYIKNGVVVGGRGIPASNISKIVLVSTDIEDL